MLVPVSLLGAFEYCPRKVFLERVLRIAVPPKDVMVKGSVKHSAFELTNSADKALICSVSASDSAASVFERFSNSYSEGLRTAVKRNEKELLSAGVAPDGLFAEFLPAMQNEAKYRSALAYSFAASHSVFGDDLWQRIAPKIISELPVASEKLFLTGRIDQIQQFPDALVPVELKSGKLPGEVWKSHKLQLAAYALLLEDKFNASITKGVVRYIDHDAAREVLINPFLKHEVRSIVKALFELLNSQKLPEKVINANKCNACSLKADCFSSKPEKLLEKSNKQAAAQHQQQAGV